MECSHIKDGSFSNDFFKAKLKTLPELNKIPCFGCKREVESRWLCLECAEVNCGRFVKGHASNHFKSTGHCFSLDLETKACHCYSCDEYVTAGKWEDRLNQIRKLLSEEQYGLSKSIAAGLKHKVHHITGLNNLGNTCFMNVVMQILSHSKPLRLHYNASGIKQESHSFFRITRAALLAKKSLWTEICHLMDKMWNTTESAIAPQKFLETVWKMMPTVFRW
jgi:uncharacterized UBP type Zn finger protein